MTNRQSIFLFLTLTFIGFLLYQLAPILTPFLVAALLAYLSDPIVNRLVKLGLSRNLAVTLVFLLLITGIILLLIAVIPMLQRQIQLFIMKLPDMANWLQNWLLPKINPYLDTPISTTQIDITSVKNAIVTHWDKAGNMAATVWQTVSRSGHHLLVWLINLILIPVVTFYLLRDWHLVLTNAHSLLPRRVEVVVLNLLRECNEVLGAFFRGQLIVMLVLGVFYSVGLAIIGLDLALLIGIIAGLISIIPYVGMIVGILLAVIAAAVQFHDLQHVIYALIVFTVGHLFEAMLLTPWLVGDKIGLHPVAVIFAILAGGQLFGFFGILLALPTAAVIMVWLRYLKRHYITSKFYVQQPGNGREG